MYCIYSSLLHLCSYCGPISLRTTPSFHFLSCISPHLHTHDSLRKRERKARGRRERRRSSDSYTIENTTIINLYFLSFFSAVMMESEKEVGATQLLPHFWSKKGGTQKFTFHSLFICCPNCFFRSSHTPQQLLLPAWVPQVLRNTFILSSIILSLVGLKRYGSLQTHVSPKF